MNNKGFTLVEILAVVVLIALIFGMGVPGVMKISKNMKERSYRSKTSLVEKAGELWGQDNKALLQADTCDIDGNSATPEQDCYKVGIWQLIDEDYLETEERAKIVYKNPINDNEMRNICVYIYKKNNRVYAKFSGIDTSCACPNTICTS